MGGRPLHRSAGQMLGCRLPALERLNTCTARKRVLGTRIGSLFGSKFGSICFFTERPFMEWICCKEIPQRVVWGRSNSGETSQLASCSAHHLFRVAGRQASNNKHINSRRRQTRALWSPCETADRRCRKIHIYIFISLLIPFFWHKEQFC